MTTLRELKVDYLRGSASPFTLPFGASKKLTIIYGENGTGKTTICDAIEFVATGSISSLDGRGLGNTSRYWPTLGKKPEDISVTLTTSAGSCNVKVVKGDVVISHPDLQPKVEVLRRTQMLRLLEARPADRYAAIARFIDVSGVEQSEATLRDAINNLAVRRTDAIARVHENSESLQSFWDTGGNPGADQFAWAQEQLSADPIALADSMKALGALRLAYEHLVPYAKDFTDLSTKLAASTIAATDAAAVVARAIQSTTEDAPALVGVLEATSAFLDKRPRPEQCPVCETSDGLVDLQNRIAARLQLFAGLKTARDGQIATTRSQARADEDLRKLREKFARARDSLESNRTGRDWGPQVALPSAAAPTDLESLAEWLAQCAKLPSVWLTIEREWTDHSKFVDVLRQALTSYRKNFAAQNELSAVIPRLERARDIVANERRTFTDGILASIAEEVGRLYELVHPGEGLEKISLQLDANRRASLEIEGSFCGQANLPPGAYFSQSHLDTLGVCAFIALAKMESPADRILILDDVLTSVDEPHVDRMIEMLFEEAAKFHHCVITTHYKPWRHKLRWGWLQNGECHFVELGPWTIVDGMKLANTVPEVERLRVAHAAAEPDLQIVCSKAGIVLEALLDFLTRQYGCAVPRRHDDRYTLGDLLPSVDRKLRDALRVEVLGVDPITGAPAYTAVRLGPILNELIRIAQVRNIFGAHFSELSFVLMDSDALSFGGQVLALADAIVDKGAGWPKNNKSGSYWATAGETRRMHPLGKPS